MITLKDCQAIQASADRIKLEIQKISSHFSRETVSGETHAVLSQLQVSKVMLDGWNIPELEEWEP